MISWFWIVTVTAGFRRAFVRARPQCSPGGRARMPPIISLTSCKPVAQAACQ